jgi:hypothetical protein
MLCLNICDRVTSCCWQTEPTAASIVLGSLKPVFRSDSFNVFLLAINGGGYDFFLADDVTYFVGRCCPRGSQRIAALGRISIRLYGAELGSRQ